MINRQLIEFYSFQFYKKRIAFFILIFTLPYLLQAQKDTIKNNSLFLSKSKGFFSILYLKMETFNVINNNSNISIKLPYNSNDIVTGTSNNDTFKLNSSTPLKNSPTLIGLGLEINKNKNCFNLQFLFAVNYFTSGSYGGSGFSTSLGYGRAFDCSISKKKFAIKPTLNISWSQFEIPIGNIDNQNKYIFALDHTYDPTFTITNNYKHSTSKTIIKKATDLSLIYNTNFYTLCPQITIANNRMQRIYWAFNLGWNIQLYNKYGLKINQNGGGQENTTSFTNSNIDLKVNGQKTTNFPYKLGSYIIGFSLGFYMNK